MAKLRPFNDQRRVDMMTRLRKVTRAFVWTALMAGLTLSLGARPAWSQDVDVNIGTLPAGKSITITFDVTVNDPLPAGTTQVSNQGAVSGSNFTDMLTDDPDTPAPDDPTVTAIVAFSPFDLNQDGNVDTLDLGIVVSCFSQPAACNPDADLNGDGIINILDVSLVVSNFT